MIKIEKYRTDGTRFETSRFKYHLKRMIKEGADTSNEAWCGYYPIGGNDGTLLLKSKFKKVTCKKCIQLFNYYTKNKKKKLSFQK